MTIADAPGLNALTAMLDAARERTMCYVASLSGEQWLGPYLTIVNPPLWEIGHVGWFQEHWCLRHADQGLAPSMLDGADALYDSAKVAHATRWGLPLPDVSSTLAYLQRVLDAVKARLRREGATPHLAYFVQLAVFHEDMHNEAFDYTLQTHGIARDLHAVLPVGERVDGDAAIPGGRMMLGAEPSSPFVFDNEKWAHEVNVAPFRMARAAVSNGEFAAFVDDGGYTRRDLWCDGGWRWREEHGVTLPLYWKSEQKQILRRCYADWRPIDLEAAAVHVNWFEAQAYCRWAQRRLPTEAEWEFAAAASPGSPQKRRYPWGDETPTPRHANLYGEIGRAHV